MKSLSHLFADKHTREQLIRYLLLLGVLAGYFGYMSYHYGLATGGMSAALTWSFFVLCTPVADAGFLLDFPVRLLTGLRMLLSEIMVWILAFLLNAYAYFFQPGAYEVSALLRVFHHILETPLPNWGIIVLCMAGTFLSVFFGDEIFDVASHKDREKYHAHGFKWKLVAVFAFFGLILVAYTHLIETMGIEQIFAG